MGGNEFLAAMNRCDFLEEYLEEKLHESFNSPEYDKSKSLLLSHVGILDINKELEALGTDAQKALVELNGLGGSFSLYAFRRTVEQEVADIFASGDDRNDFSDYQGGNTLVSWQDLNILQNSFYPVAPNGFIEKLANTRLWSRLTGVPQLGWDRNYPLANEHSRGSHSLFAAVNVARVLQSLYEKSPERLNNRLREDFAAEGLLEGGETDEEVALLAADLAVLLAMSHDIYTPAGGDMMKNAVGLDEETEIENLLANKESELEAEYLRVVGDRGLKDEHVQFVIDCVQGKSHSLVGQLIHSEEGDVLEQDRLAYTLQDLFSAGVLGVALPRSFYAEEELLHEAPLIEYYQRARTLLSDPTVSCVGPVLSDSVRPSLTMLDVCDDYILNDDLALVCTRPDKLIWLASFRAMMSAEFYQGSKLRGQEHDMIVQITQLLGKEESRDIFEGRRLLRSTNHDLQARLRDLDDPNVARLLRDLNNVIYPHMYESQLVADTSDFDDTWLKLPIKIKPGLDTKVLSEGEVLPLGEYARGNESSPAVVLLCSVLDEYAGMTRVIRRLGQ